MTPAQFRRMALGLSGAEERSHMGHPDFRAGGRIFATLGAPDAAHGMVKLSPEEQAFFVHAAPKAFTPAAGAWGRGGSTLVVLAHVKTDALRAAMTAAWAAVAERPGRERKRTAAAAKGTVSKRTSAPAGTTKDAGATRAPARSGARRGTPAFAAARDLARHLPGVEESTSYGTPALKVRGRFLARLKEDGASLVVKVGSIDERDLLLKSDPRVFYITEHYRAYPDILVRLDLVRPAVLARLLEDAWRSAAPRKLVAAFDAR